MIKTNRFLKILTIILFIISIAFTATFIILTAINFLVDRYVLKIIMTVLLPIIISFFSIVYLQYFMSKTSINELKKENSYSFGVESYIYNTYFFTNRVKNILKKHKFRNSNAYIICFTATKQAVMHNAYRNSMVLQFLNLITRFLVDTFGDENAKNPFPFAYGYHRDSFLLFMFGDENSIKEKINVIENNLYQIAYDNQINIYVQPFFGVTKVEFENRNSLFIQIAQAANARNSSEKKYETISFFDSSDTNVIGKNDVDTLRSAIENEELVVFYQPKYSLTHKKFISSEALVRWDSKEHGLIMPSVFIEMAEQSGLIHMIDKYVLEHVCRDLRENKNKGRDVLPVSVNFSVQEFYDTNFIDELTFVCDKYNISHDLIEIEVTESTSQTNSFMSSAIIGRLKKLNFRVLMDDFGTGFSNIENLMLLPFDAVKLDRSYIVRIVNDNKSRDFVKFLISLCKTNNLEVIAEGVDDENQVRILKQFGCNTIQGYYFSKPIRKEEYDVFLLTANSPFGKTVRKDIK